MLELEALVTLEDSPQAGKRLHGELRENYSLRVGKHRIIYYVSGKDKTVCVIAIDPRKTIYK